MIPGLDAILAVHDVETHGQGVDDPLDEGALFGDLTRTRRDLAFEFAHPRVARDNHRHQVRNAGGQRHLVAIECVVSVNSHHTQRLTGGRKRHDSVGGGGRLP